MKKVIASVVKPKGRARPDSIAGALDNSTNKSLEQLAELSMRVDSESKGLIKRLQSEFSGSPVDDPLIKMMLTKFMHTEAVARSNKFQAQSELDSMGVRTLVWASQNAKYQTFSETRLLPYFMASATLDTVQLQIAKKEEKILSNIRPGEETTLKFSTETKFGTQEEVSDLHGLLGNIHTDTQDKCVGYLMVEKSLNVDSPTKREPKVLASLNESFNAMGDPKSKYLGDLISGYSSTYTEKLFVKADTILKEQGAVRAIEYLNSAAAAISDVQRNLPTSFVDIRGVHEGAEEAKNRLQHHISNIDRMRDEINRDYESQHPISQVINDSNPLNREHDEKVVFELSAEINRLGQDISNTSDEAEKSQLFDKKIKLENFVNEYKQVIEHRDSPSRVQEQQQLARFSESTGNRSTDGYISGFYDPRNDKEDGSLGEVFGLKAIDAVSERAGRNIEQHDEKAPKTEKPAIVVSPASIEYLTNAKETKEELKQQRAQILIASKEKELRAEMNKDSDKLSMRLTNLANNLNKKLNEHADVDNLSELQDDDLRAVVASFIQNSTWKGNEDLKNLLSESGPAILRRAIDGKQSGKMNVIIASEMKKEWEGANNRRIEQFLDIYKGNVSSPDYKPSENEMQIVAEKVCTDVIQASGVPISEKNDRALDKRLHLAVCRNVSTNAEVKMNTIRQTFTEAPNLQRDAANVSTPVSASMQETKKAETSHQNDQTRPPSPVQPSASTTPQGVPEKADSPPPLPTKPIDHNVVKWAKQGMAEQVKIKSTPQAVKPPPSWAQSRVKTAEKEPALPPTMKK